jgi:uncharacterized small protein (DUF1192 family)
MSDLVERLNKRRTGFPGYPLGCDLVKDIGDAADEIERLRAELKTCCDHDNIWKHAQEMGYTKVIDEQKAEIERLRAVVDAAKEMASDYEAYEPRGDNWLDYPLHDVDILSAFKRRLAALEVSDE